MHSGTSLESSISSLVSSAFPFLALAAGAFLSLSFLSSTLFFGSSGALAFAASGFLAAIGAFFFLSSFSSFLPDPALFELFFLGYYRLQVHAFACLDQLAVSF